MSDIRIIAAAQIAPVWGDKSATLAKAASAITEAADAGATLVAFGEALVPGYPFWVERTGGAKFDDPVQKKLFSRYLEAAVDVNRDLGPIQTACGACKIACYLGVIEAAPDRGGHSLYCSYVYIDPHGHIQSVHRKLVPTYEERLVWAPGDGHGLVTHSLPPFTVGGLNCFENWMPLTRAALMGMGEDLHVASWPGNLRNTELITRAMALEGRSYVLSVSGLMAKDALIEAMPEVADLLAADERSFFADGGSCIAAPDGHWVLPPVVGEEGVFTAEIDHARVREERQIVDPVGHYSRPDVLSMRINRKRQSTIQIETPDGD